jgi:hypothetical protein
MNKILNLRGYENNITSQFGEDGLIEEIFIRIGIENRTCVEFGAWDGIYLSNTWNLWHEKGWKAILIEGDEYKAKLLRNNVTAFPEVKVHRAYISDEGDNSLDQALKYLNVPNTIDLISIDVDGNEYHILKAMKEYKPRLIVVEFNPTIPHYIEYVCGKDSRIGSSALSLYLLAKKMGYHLIACTQTNLFLITTTDFKKMGMEEPSLADIMPSDNLTYIISSYDGEMFLNREPQYASLKRFSFFRIFIDIVRSAILRVVTMKDIDFVKSSGFKKVKIYEEGPNQA